MKTTRKIYTAIRNIAGDKYQAALSKLIFDMGMKPTVKPDSKNGSFPAAEKGGLIISADFEMAWAFRYSKRTKDYLAAAARERKHTPILVQLFEEYQIPIIWATVGHLFLESCQKGDHDWMTRIPHFDDHWRFTEGDWYDHDPYTDYKKDSAWYAPDLIELILKSSVQHEIGCHTFSHIDCTYKNCPPQVLDDELMACKKAAKAWNIELKSLVFPGGTHGNYGVLAKHGFKIYRKNTDYDLSYPYRDNFGMLVTTSSGSFAKTKNWSADYYIHRYKKIIDKAMKTGTIAHLWLHPSVDEWTLENVIPELLKYAAAQREAGKLWIGTMNEIAEYINAKDA
ncbi:MAG: polysaccharide deacetylase family protein [Candidatus Cloacimonetes bacterium]|nr:polysaccharide deacetylase family protein [Candidatus Cloacimonadota bacterium]